MIGVEGRYLNFYVPYGYRGDIKVEAKSGNEVKTWSTKVVDDVHHEGGKRATTVLKNQYQYTYLDAKWDYQTKTTLPPYQRLSMVKKSLLGQTMTMVS